MSTARRAPTTPPLTWRLGVYAVIWFLHRGFGWRVQARRPDRVPRPDEPLIVVFNHTSNVDAFLVADTVWRRLGHWCQPLVKVELLERPLLGRLLRHVGAVPVARSAGVGREAAYVEAVTRLRAGRTILLAPEATITHDGSLLPLRHGAARLALEAGVDVLAVTHFGAQRAFSPVVRTPERDAMVTMAMDVITPRPDEDASSLTGRIAATMIDRSAELRDTYPQRDASAPWWPPYAVPASPTATARENLTRYRHSMAEAVAHARRRMAEVADEYDVEERVSQARRRVARLAEDYDVEERMAQARARASAAAEDLSARSRARTEAFAEQTRHRMDELTAQAREVAGNRGTQRRGPRAGGPSQGRGPTGREPSGQDRAGGHDSASSDTGPPGDAGAP